MPKSLFRNNRRDNPKTVYIDIHNHPDALMGGANVMKLGYEKGGEGFREFRKIYIEALRLCRDDKTSPYKKRVEKGTKYVTSEMRKQNLAPYSYYGFMLNRKQIRTIIADSLRDDISPANQLKAYQERLSAKSPKPTTPAEQTKQTNRQISNMQFEQWLKRSPSRQSGFSR